MKNEDLKDWQVRFCEEYLKNGNNATKAYMVARPSVKANTAAVASNKLLKNEKIQEKMQEIKAEISRRNHMDIEERYKILTQIARTGEDKDRIKAIDAINKMEGIAEEKQEININNNIPSFSDFSVEKLKILIQKIDEEEEEDGGGDC